MGFLKDFRNPFLGSLWAVTEGQGLPMDMTLLRLVVHLCCLNFMECSIEIGIILIVIKRFKLLHSLCS